MRSEVDKFGSTQGVNSAKAIVDLKDECMQAYVNKLSVESLIANGPWRATRQVTVGPYFNH